MNRERMEEIVSKNYGELVRTGHYFWNGRGEDATNTAIITAIEKTDECHAEDERGGVTYIKGIIKKAGKKKRDDKHMSIERLHEETGYEPAAQEGDEEQEKLRERILQIAQIADKRLQEAIGLVLDGYEMSEAAEAVGMSQGELTKSLMELGGRRRTAKNQMNLF